MLDESYIQIAIELAKKGKGKVSPKPLIGALLVKNDKIIGAAYRNSPTEENTELIAIKNSKESTEGAVLYTNIEPCSLEPGDSDCIDLLLQSKIKRVVIGSVNPHPQFGGSAIKKIKKSGIELKIGVLEKECYELNKFYFKQQTTLLPYVTLKMAVTLDGKIADSEGNSKWITSVESRSFVHELRGEYDAVLVGYNTVRIDQPRLTVRLVEGRNPKRIILDTKLQLKHNNDLIKNNNDGNLFIITSKKNKDRKKKLNKFYEQGVNVIFASEKKNGKIDIADVMKKLSQRNINSLLVEGGGRVFSDFLKNKIEDEVLIFIGPKFLGNGISLTDNLGVKNLQKAYKYSIRDIDKIGEDALIRLVRR